MTTITTKKPLSHLRFDEKNSKGRKKSETEDSTINPFTRDLIKILLSEAIRRLSFRTQVMAEADKTLNPHIRRRSSHSLEVTAIAMTISELLDLNTLLCQIIAMAHDLGHVPYGHLGERFFSELINKLFKHDIFGVFILQHLEKLNLSYEVLEGILNHSRGNANITTNASIQEYDVVMLADKIAYIFHDLNDEKRHHTLDSFIVPKNLIKSFGRTQKEQINTCIKALVEESTKEGRISFCKSDVAKKFSELKDYMYKCFYGQLDNSLDRYFLKDRLEKVYSYIKKTFPENDPVVLTALLAEFEIDEIGLMLEKKDEHMLEKLMHKKHFSISEFLTKTTYKELQNIDYYNGQSMLNWGNKKRRSS